MIRLITTARLRRLEADIAGLRQERVTLTSALLHERTARSLCEQARDHFERAAAKWEARASRFIDQVGMISGTLTSPAMADPVPPPSDPTRRVLAALNVHELKRPQPSAAPAAPAILGVNDDAAAAAVAGVLR